MTANESDWRMWRLKDQYESGINLWNSWVINVPAVSCRPLQAVGTNGTILSAGTLFWQCSLPICKCRIPATSFVSSYMFIGIWLLGCGHGLPICLVFFFFFWELRNNLYVCAHIVLPDGVASAWQSVCIHFAWTFLYTSLISLSL